jgi:hypothetical protein
MGPLDVIAAARAVVEARMVAGCSFGKAVTYGR